MKASVTMVIAWIAAGTALATPQTKKLTCTTGQPYQTVHATLDYSTFDPGSGFFDVIDATLVDNFATASLSCAGHTLDNVTCVGFMFMDTESIVKVKVRKADDNDGHIMEYTMLEGMGLHGGPWPCEVN